MTSTNPDFQLLKNLEEKLWIAEYRFNREWIESIFADDFFEYGRSGRIYSREQCLNVAPQRIDAIMPLPDFTMRYLSMDIVQTTYKSIVTYADELEYANRSSIWEKTAEGWKLKFHQGTPTQDI
ncbi:MAG: hypothetical protein B7X02_01810 [Rhodospirillales bacterium 12-54-5]|nr:MAG: hypothetical protein B7X02_01810 [Rhodospirillales bacterium 12-54-5]